MKEQHQAGMYHIMSFFLGKHFVYCVEMGLWGNKSECWVQLGNCKNSVREDAGWQARGEKRISLGNKNQ